MNERKTKKVKDTVLIAYWTSERGDILNAVEFHNIYVIRLLGKVLGKCTSENKLLL